MWEMELNPEPNLPVLYFPGHHAAADAAAMPNQVLMIKRSTPDRRWCFCTITKQIS